MVLVYGHWQNMVVVDGRDAVVVVDGQKRAEAITRV
jgi:hypothetical protein